MTIQTNRCRKKPVYRVTLKLLRDEKRRGVYRHACINSRSRFIALGDGTVLKLDAIGGLSGVASGCVGGLIEVPNATVTMEICDGE